MPPSSACRRRTSTRTSVSRKKYQLNFPLLADTDRAVARAYGTIGGGLGGTLRGMLGMAERVTFVIDEQGRIAHVIDDVNTKGHAEQVLALL